MDLLNAYDLTFGEEAEEEEMEVDEALPAVASASARMADAELYGADSVGGGTGASANDAAAATRSDSNTREYLSSLPGSPRSESPTLPTIGVEWESLEVLMEHVPANQRERARRVQEVGLFNRRILKEYLQIHLMSIFPGQPDLTWDHEALWTQCERRNYDTFKDIVAYGMYQLNWGSFVEQWFVQQEFENNRPSDIPWESD